MPHRAIAAKELGALMSVLSHPHRLQIIEGLRGGEQDVNALQTLLGISHSGVSQHLSLLRAHRLVSERRAGRHVFYRLRRPELAAWLITGLDYLEDAPEELKDALARARALWSGADAGEAGGQR